MSILQTISKMATSGLVDQIAGSTSASQANVEKGMSAAIPGVLAALLGAGSRKGGADAISTALSRQEPGMFDRIGDMLGQEPEVAEKGNSMLSNILGSGQLGVLASKLMSYAGLPEAAAGPLLGSVGSMVMAALGKEAHDKNLDGAGVVNLLQSERESISSALPADFAKSLEGAGFFAPETERVAEAGTQSTRPVEPTRQAQPKAEPKAEPKRAEPQKTPPPRTSAPAETKKSNWWTWLLAAIVLAALAYWFLGGNDPEPVVEEQPAATQ